jgi:hypothetical protein
MKTWMPVWLIMLFCLSGMTELQAQWIQSQGIDEADVSDVIVLDSTIFICADGIWSRNVNGGAWQERLPGVSFERMEACGDALFAWGTFTCYRSPDHGNTWQDMNTYWGTIAHSLCIIDSTLFFSTPYGMFRSDNLGNTVYPIMTDSSFIYPMVAGEGNSSLFWYKNYACDYLFESTDKGITWDTILWTGLPSNFYVYDISRLDSNIWLAANTGVYWRSDSQQQWVPIQDTLGISKLDILNGTLFACSWYKGVFRLNPANYKWFPENTGLETLTVNGFCDYAGGLFLATDFGPYKCTTPYNWIPFYDGLNLASIDALAFLGNEVWSVSKRGTFVSTDQGVTFTKHEMKGIFKPASLLLTDSIFYALSNDSVWISTDHGNSWAAYNSGLPVPTQWPFLSLCSLVKQGGYLFLGTNLGLYRSPCQNISWTKVISFTSQDNHPVYLFCDDSTLLAVKEVNTSSNFYYTFRSADSGQTFDSVSLPVGSQPVFTGNGIDFYALYYNQIFKSTDEGISWSTLPIGNPAMHGYLLAAKEPALIVGGSKINATLYDLYLAVTFDDGITWYDIQENLPVSSWPVLSQLAINQQRTFASPSGYGLWYQDNVLAGIKSNQKNAAGLTIAPNPAHSIARVQFDMPESSSGNITLAGITGNRIYSSPLQKFGKGKNSVQIDVSGFPQGLYIVSLRTDRITMQGKMMISE